VAAGAVVLFLHSPMKLFAATGVAIGAWLVGGALTEVAERCRLGRAPLPEALRRLRGLPRGAWGMTLAHLGLGLFVLGACFETTWKAENAQNLAPGAGMPLGAYTLTLQTVGDVAGPNYDAERAIIAVTRAGRPVCTAAPERRFYPANRQNTSQVAICDQGLDDVYVVLGDRAPDAAGPPRWVVRGYFNPWARLIFFGPLIMALGGAISLSDRRLRFALPRRATVPAALEPAE
jgi:cytochrome c-type biogenesis protein CcmF